MKKFFRIFWLVVLGVIVLGTFFFLWSKSKPKTTSYEIVEVTRQSIENISVATGKVSPRDEVMIKPQISGIVAELHKEAGQYVSVGEIIATVKVIPEMGQLNSAESRVRLAEINLNQTKNEHERQKQLFEQQVISREEMEQSDVVWQRAQEELENAQDNLEIVRDGISRRSAQLSNTQIRSTISGMILDIPVKVGNSVIQSNTFNDGTTIATVADMGNMIFIGTIDETEIGRVHTGMPIKLSIGALENRTFDAVLEYISPKAMEQSGAILFEIKAAAQIPDSVTVRAGYSANAEIVLARADSVPSLPEGTLTFRGDSTFVHVLTDSLAHPPVFTERPVKIGLSDGVNVEILSGIGLNEKVRGNEITGK